jgi:hypothetical protein
VNLALVRTMESTQSNTRLSFDKDSSLVVTEPPWSILVRGRRLQDRRDRRVRNRQAGRARWPTGQGEQRQRLSE